MSLMLLSGKKLSKQGETEQLLIYILQYRISKANIVTQIVNPTTKMEPNRGFPPPRQTILFSQFPPKKYFELCKQNYQDNPINILTAPFLNLQR